MEQQSSLRHGLLNDQTHLDILQSHYYSHWDLKRNTSSATPSPPDNAHKITDWKSQSNKRKTTTAALVLCLNLGIPPPDIQKPQDCPILESFVDPTTYADPKKALQAIGKSLQTNYESLSSRTKYKQLLDPSVEDLKRTFTTLRRTTKDERILFHYNGHGVPQPTQSGEIWVFNRGYTQYIPVSLYDLQSWIGAPCIFVIDTSAAGNVIENNKKFIQKRIEDEANQVGDVNAPSPASSYIESIQLGACRSNEILPLNPDLPADLFSCCLTSPIEMSVKWFVLSSPLSKHGYYDILKNKEGTIVIPGKLSDRRTPLGELNWIFTAITDTIAWTSLSRPLFKKLFRQDLMVAALFRNFLLAKKVMPLLGCHPISDPPLPNINQHPMWESWELAIDEVLAQLVENKRSEPASNDLPLVDIPQLQVPEPKSDAANGTLQNTQTNGARPPTSAGSANNPSINLNGANQTLLNYQHSSFFEQHLTAFEIWLQYGSSDKEPPQQLPVVLQVLLSQAHRLRALILLSRFLDLGPWAVYLALSIGIFPYILRLLQSPAPELKPVLTFIWARIMSVDYKNTQQELCKDRGFNYFVSILCMQTRKDQQQGMNYTSNGGAAADNKQNDVSYDEQKAMSAFILAMFVKDYRQGQKLCFSVDLAKTCIYYVETSESPLLRQWSALLISELLANHREAIVVFLRSGFTDKLLQIVNDPIPEIRASIINAFSNLISLDTDENLDSVNVYNGLKDEVNQQEIKLAIEVLNLVNDGSPLIRREVVCFFSRFVMKYLQFFIVSAFSQLEEEVTLVDNPSAIDEVRRKSPAYGSIFSSIWKVLLILSEDPHNEVKDYTEQVVDYIIWHLNESPLAEVVNAMEEYLLHKRSSSSSIDGQRNDSPTENKLRTIPVNGSKPSSSEANGNGNIRRVQSLSVKPTMTNNDIHNNGDKRITSTSSVFSFSDKLKNRISFTGFLKNLGFNELPGSSGSGDNVSIHSKFGGLYSSGNSNGNHATLSYGIEPKPLTPRFKPRRRENGKPILPLKSEFYEYSAEYFQEPQIGNSEPDEPGSEEYTKRLWRRNRNEGIIAETQPQKELALTGNWQNLVTTLENKTPPKLIKFSQFENYVVATDDKDNITTFDWKTSKQLSRFSNGNPFGTKITDIKFLNEDDVSLLLTGSSDGSIRIYKNYHSTESFQLISAWRALTDILLTPRSIGLITEWQQSRGTLLVSGDVKVIKIWDAPREKCINDIPVRSASGITSMTSDQVSGNIFVGGFADGTIRVYDRRLDTRDSMIKSWRTTRSNIRNIHMQRGGFRELISGSSDGNVNLWDIRKDEPVLNYKAFEKAMTTAIIHEHAPVVACAYKTVDMYSTAGELLTSIKNPLLNNYIPNNYGGSRTSSYINNLALHPHRMLMSTNYNQSTQINLYNCVDTDDIVEEYI